MLLLLQSRGQVTAAELAGRLEVSQRTVYRDAEALGSAGVPVYTERGRGGGIRLLPGYRTDVTGLTRDEARALFVLTTGGAHADLGLQPAIRSALAKVMRAVPAPFQAAAAAASQRILVDPAQWMRRPEPVSSQLSELQAAVFTDRRLRLRYRHGGQQAASSHTVDPYGLVSKAGVWYLVADHRSRPRLFRVSRVVSSAVAQTPARRREGVDLAAAWEVLRVQVEERPAPVQVLARVRRAQLDMFCRICAAHLAGPVATPDDPEWAVVPLRFAAVPAARILLGFGADVEVVSPAGVRADLAATATSVVARYGAEAAPGTGSVTGYATGPLQMPGVLRTSRPGGAQV
jgi:predicted DNA-binding transcriptional regulator YafY